MKQTAVFELDKSSIYEEVNKHTSYEGAKQDATLYDKVRTKSGDKTLLERWWNDACGLVTTVLVPYVTSIATEISTTTGEGDEAVTTTTDGFVVTVSLPSNWNVSVKTPMGNALVDLVTDYILQQWYLLLNIEGQATVAQSNQQGHIAKIGELLYTRIRPTRTTYEEDIYNV